MGQPADDRGTGAAVGEAYAAARELLQRAEGDAARIRAEADRYVQRRHLEADLVVAKARRVLAIAEERAAAIEAGTAPTPKAEAVADTVAIDLTADAPVLVGSGPRRAGTALDSILASAVSRAIERALPADG